MLGLLLRKYRFIVLTQYLFNRHTYEVTGSGIKQDITSIDVLGKDGIGGKVGYGGQQVERTEPFRLRLLNGLHQRQTLALPQDIKTGARNKQGQAADTSNPDNFAFGLAIHFDLIQFG